MVAQTIGRQLVRAGTSVGVNYRAACRGRSKAEFAAKLGIVEEEADESAFWMEIIIEAGLMERRLIQPLLDEAEELVAIMVASRKSVNRKSAI
jgi:four helix bundle protein